MGKKLGSAFRNKTALLHVSSVTYVALLAPANYIKREGQRERESW